MTIDSSRGGGIRGGVHAHARPIREADIVVIDGLRVTSPARTAVDLAMAGDHGQALSIVDSARLTVRFPNADTRPPVTVDQLEESAEVLGWRPGLPMFRRAMAESVQDSGSAGSRAPGRCCWSGTCPSRSYRRTTASAGGTTTRTSRCPG
ncbi:hypothetical protein [Tsukamurella sp. PLM1]|uniref:hypothetical protein n=1 Tax=Tsukamurella sp. PLM1 TaxID=2929795 RepID=UPI0020BF6CB6|nr:hypothetical protein [Tsukamurella sp. PLM1]